MSGQPLDCQFRPGCDQIGTTGQDLSLRNPTVSAYFLRRSKLLLVSDLGVRPGTGPLVITPDARVAAFPLPAV
jgi:hypothetical protein